MKAKIIVTLYIKNVAGALYTVNYNENSQSLVGRVDCASYRQVYSSKQFFNTYVHDMIHIMFTAA